MTKLMDEELCFLVYVSRETFPMCREDLTDILDDSRRMTAKHHLTGMLLYQDGSFMQVIEGDRYAVCDYYEALRQEPWHKNIDLIILEPVEKRAFSEWSMGFAHDEIEPDERQSNQSAYIQLGNEARNAPRLPSMQASFLNMFAHTGKRTPQVAEEAA